MVLALCGADFNETLDNSEYFGAHDRSEWQIEGFCECLDVCDAEDLGFQWVLFTWDNMRHGDSNVKFRLDCYVANPATMSLYSGSFFGASRHRNQIIVSL